MKHIVTVTTSNPAHEHISLRRRQSTTNYMVEARNEDEALLRASAHFRRLGHYIHETKIFKKKDEQLNEFTGAAAAAARATAAALRSPATRGVLQSGKTSLGKLFKDEVKNAGIGYGTSAIANAILPSTHDKETSLGSVISGRIGGSAAGGAISAITRKLATKVPQKMSTNIADLLKSVGNAVGQTTGKIVISPTTRPDLKPSPQPQPKPAPFPVPQPGPAPVLLPPAKPVPAPFPVPQPKPAPFPVPQPVPVPKQSPPVTSPPVTRPSPKASPKSDPRQLPATSGKGGGKPPVGTPRGGTPRGGTPGRPFVLPRLRLSDRPDQDIGTLGQYRGMFPLYQFADFNSLRESQVKPMNAIGRVMTNRKEKNKENAEAEKNKINMEPTLKSGKN